MGSPEGQLPQVQNSEGHKISKEKKLSLKQPQRQMQFDKARQSRCWNPPGQVRVAVGDAAQPTSLDGSLGLPAQNQHPHPQLHQPFHALLCLSCPSMGPPPHRQSPGTRRASGFCCLAILLGAPHRPHPVRGRAWASKAPPPNPRPRDQHPRAIHIMPEAAALKAKAQWEGGTGVCHNCHYHSGSQLLCSLQNRGEARHGWSKP